MVAVAFLRGSMGPWPPDFGFAPSPTFHTLGLLPHTTGVVAPQVVKINYSKTAPYIHLESYLFSHIYVGPKNTPQLLECDKRQCVAAGASGCSLFSGLRPLTSRGPRAYHLQTPQGPNDTREEFPSRTKLMQRLIKAVLNYPASS